MSHESQSAAYRDPALRSRAEMCAREQAHLTYSDDPDPANQSLAFSVITGDIAAIDALIAAVAVGPNGDALDNDADLLAAMQTSWPTVAAAYYGMEEEEPA